MDWISHLLFAIPLGALLLKDRSRKTLAVIAFASLLPDIDMLWQHRSELHAPLVLLAFALPFYVKNRALFSPLLLGFWSHSALDIFLFDNSKQTIKNLANQIVSNESAAQNIQDTVMHFTSADGIMLLFPLSDEKFSILLGEESYAVIAAFIIVAALLIFLWLHYSKQRDF